MSLAGMYPGTEAFQSTVHASGAHAKAYWRETPQVHGKTVSLRKCAQPEASANKLLQACGSQLPCPTQAEAAAGCSLEQIKRSKLFPLP